MKMGKFKLMPVPEDTVCPFCKSLIPSGASICKSCNAKHGAYGFPLWDSIWKFFAVLGSCFFLIMMAHSTKITSFFVGALIYGGIALSVFVILTIIRYKKSKNLVFKRA